MKTRLLIPVIIFGIVIIGVISAFFMFSSMPSDTWSDHRTGFTGVAPPDEINKKMDCLSRGGVWEHTSCSIEETVQAIQTKTKLADSNVECYGNARCFSGKVIKIIDGDTIKVVGESTTSTGESIRFALASAPEIDTLKGIQARDYIAKICPVGSIAIIDEDDIQTQGSYGRVIAQIHCNGISLNESILGQDWGRFLVSFAQKVSLLLNHGR